MKITACGIALGVLLTVGSVTSKADVLEDVDFFEAGGNYYCYPWLEKNPPQQTPTPVGYQPFHLEHYGRHGSRWHIGNGNYDRPYTLLKKAHDAGKLTPLGEKTFETVVKIRDEFKKGRDGELSDKGAIQHQGIGRRMAQNYPEIFNPDANIDARSTIVIRSILSMFNGLNGIQSVVPNINIKTDASHADMWYMNFEDSGLAPEKDYPEADSLYRDFVKKHANKGEYMKKLFNDQQYAKDSIGSALFSPLYSLLVNTQSHYAQPWLTDSIFSIDEAREQWMIRNVGWFIGSGNSALTDNDMPFSQANLLRNIIESADTAINSAGQSVNLRYGHDTIVMPLSCLLEIDEFGQEINDLEQLDELGWHDYKAVPMAGNIQIVFYRPSVDEVSSPDDVLVKVLLNERETTLPLGRDAGPYYKWNDFKEYYLNKIGVN